MAGAGPWNVYAGEVLCQQNGPCGHAKHPMPMTPVTDRSPVQACIRLRGRFYQPNVKGVHGKVVTFAYPFIRRLKRVIPLFEVL